MYNAIREKKNPSHANGFCIPHFCVSCAVSNQKLIFPANGGTIRIHQRFCTSISMCATDTHTASSLLQHCDQTSAVEDSINVTRTHKIVNMFNIAYAVRTQSYFQRLQECPAHHNMHPSTYIRICIFGYTLCSFYRMKSYNIRALTTSLQRWQRKNKIYSVGDLCDHCKNL